MDGQKIAALDINQVRRHHDKFSGDLKVKHPKSIEILKVLAGDSFDRNVVDVDLILPDKIEQEIKRSLEDIELNFVISLHQSESATEATSPFMCEAVHEAFHQVNPDTRQHPQ